MRELRTLLATVVAGLLVFGAACDKSGSDDGADTESASKQDTSATGGKTAGGGSELPFEATGPVAIIDGEKITAKEYNKIVREQFARSRRPMPKAAAERRKTKLLESMIDRHLIEREIEKADLSASKKEVEKELKNFKDRFPNDKAFQSFLKFQNTNEKDLKGKIKKDVKLQKLLRKKKGIEVTEKDAKKYYDKNPKKYEQPEKVKARHILIETPRGKNKKKQDDAKKRAEEIAKKAKKEGTDFAKLAKKESDGPSAKKGGDLGYFSRDRMVKEFAEKAFSMKNGEISGPVKTKFGYHIIKREGHKKAKKKKFENVKEEIISMLERKKFRRAIDEFSKELRKKAKVQKKPENIKVNVSGGKGGAGGLGGLPGGGGNLKLKMNKLKGIEKSGSGGGSKKKSK